MNKKRIYLDNNATTPLDPRVYEVIIQTLSEVQGNPSSLHREGQEARALLNKARRSIAEALKVQPQEIIFTSGGTEAVNMILRGLLVDSKGHVITSASEHAAVNSTLQALEERGTAITYISPGLWGAVTPEQVLAAIRPDTRLIALMAVNNETGVKTDIDAIAAIAHEARIPFFVDGVSLLGKEAFTIPKGVSAYAFSGHKIHGPKGIGFAFVRSSVKLPPLLTGGVQEFGKRGGTENLPAIVGMAEAVRLLAQELEPSVARMTLLRDRFEAGVMGGLKGVVRNGDGPRVCNTSNLAFEGVEGETLLARLDMQGVAASHGSACSSGALEPSRILLSMGLPRSLAASSLRFSLSRMTTEEEIDQAVTIVCREATKGTKGH